MNAQASLKLANVNSRRSVSSASVQPSGAVTGPTVMAQAVWPGWAIAVTTAKTLGSALASRHALGSSFKEELVLANTLKTTALLGGLGALIVAVAGLLGGGSTVSLFIGLLIALVVVGGSYWSSDKLALKGAKARIVTQAEAPELYDLVGSLAKRAGLPMPVVAISPSEQPNAFATGRN